MADLVHLRASATRLIKSFGKGGGFIIRAGVKRPAFMAMSDWRPAERGMVEEGAVRILIAAPQTPEPDYKLDTLEFPKGSGKMYRIIKPIGGERPDGAYVIKYDCECMAGVD